MHRFSEFKGLVELLDCQNCIWDALLSSKMVLDSNLMQKCGFQDFRRYEGKFSAVPRLAVTLTFRPLLDLLYRFQGCSNGSSVV